MITLLRFEVNLPLFPLQYQFTKSDPSRNRIEYAVILFIDIMYFDNRICRLILNTMQGFICKRIVKTVRDYPILPKSHPYNGFVLMSMLETLYSNGYKMRHPACLLESKL